MNAKGFFFTMLVAIVLIYILSLADTFVKSASQSDAPSLRAFALKSMVDSSQADFYRVAFLSGTAGLNASAVFASYVSPLFYASYNASEVIKNGTMDGASCYTVPSGTCGAGTQCCFADQTSNMFLEQWGDRLSEKLLSYGATANFTDPNVSFASTGAFSVNITANTSVLLEDVGGEGSFNKTLSAQREISTIGFVDPLFGISTAGSYARTITECPEATSGWDYRISIAIDSTVASTLTNFPAKVVLDTTNSTLWNTATCTNVRFISADETAILNYELDSGCGTSSTIFWVSVPSLAPNTTIYAYLGNTGASDGQDATSVWRDANYVGVYHLQSTGTQTDSAGYNDLSESGSCATAPAEDGNGITFTSGCYYYIDSVTSLPTGNNPSTVSFWVNSLAEGSTYESLISWGERASSSYYDAMRAYFLRMGGECSGADILSFSQWGASDCSGMSSDGSYFAAFAWDGSATTFWRDLSTTSVGRSSLSTTSSILRLGATVDDPPLTLTNTILDEVRISNVSETSDWLTAVQSQTSSAGAADSTSSPAVLGASDGYLPLASVIATATSGSGWVYGDVLNLGMTDCTALAAVEDKNKTLVLNEFGIIATTCPETANQFRGVVFNTRSAMSLENITIPYVGGFTDDITADYNLVDGTPILISTNATSAVYNVSVLRNAATSGCYQPSNGPDYLSRLENTTSESLNGSESFINSSIAAAYPRNSSWVDYLYFSNTTCESLGGCTTIRGAPGCEDNITCASGTPFQIDNSTISLNNTSTSRLGYYSLNELASSAIQPPLESITATGGTETTFTNATGTYKVHTFTTDGTLEVTRSGNAMVLVVGGGGAGAGFAGGGGAGGLIYNSSYSLSGNITVTVGAGGLGAAGTSGGNGGNSVFGTLIAIGGGGGASRTEPVDTGVDGNSGGSGGGGSPADNPPVGIGGNGTAGQGNNGGSGGNFGWGGGGGGGAGGIGSDAVINNGGNGGNGLNYSITGSDVYYAGGGGGGGYTGGGAPGTGGLGGGGNGSLTDGVAGDANTGGGGGGSGFSSYAGAAGGSGIVIVSYRTS